MIGDDHVEIEDPVLGRGWSGAPASPAHSGSKTLPSSIRCPGVWRAWSPPHRQPMHCVFEALGSACRVASGPSQQKKMFDRRAVP